MVDPQGRLTVASEQLFDPTRIQAGQVLNEEETRAAARSAAGSRQAMIFGLEGEDQMYDTGPGKGAVIAAPVPAGLPAESGALPLQAVVTLLVESRSNPALQTTLALVEVLTGYAFTHAAQQALRRVRQSSASLDLAARLISSINQTSGFRACCLQLVNDLCRQLAVDRVALGWVHGAPARKDEPENARGVQAVALSDTELLDRRTAMVRKLEAAMNECLDQEQPVLYPPPPTSGPGSDAVLSQAITHAHRELASTDARLKAASFPLRVGDAHGDRIVGVLLVEGAGEGKVDPATVELLQAALDLAARVLSVRHSDDRNLALRAWDAGVRAMAWAVGPRHTVWKAAGVALVALTLFVMFWKATYRVGAPAEMQPLERRVISVPFDGTIATVGEGIEPGRPVQAGQVLATLDTHELALGALEAEAQVLQYDKQADEALKKGNLADETQARAQADQFHARLGLYRFRIERSKIVSPITGQIVSGDLKDRLGSSVKLGDKLFEVADNGEVVVIARVSDSDIAYIKEGQTGEIAPKSRPSLSVAFTVDRVVPLSQPNDGKNIFEVRGRLDPAALKSPDTAWLRPGVEGQAKFNTVRRSLLWIGTRRVVDTLRVWLWW